MKSTQFLFCSDCAKVNVKKRWSVRILSKDSPIKYKTQVVK